MLVLSRMALLVVGVDPDSRASAVWSMMPDADVHNEVQCTIDMEIHGVCQMADGGISHECRPSGCFVGSWQAEARPLLAWVRGECPVHSSEDCVQMLL
jgi:hypothetical protein